MPFVEMRGIGKVFPGVVANADVDLDILPGEVHALLGENGAGKSTLMNILTGIYRPDAGTLHISGRSVDFRKPADAIAAGIGMVHQHFKLVHAFSVAENLQLGARHLPLLLTRASTYAYVRRIEGAFGLKVTPDAPIHRLSAGEQQRVEILKVLSRGAKLLILDEPTAVLTSEEAKLLFSVVRKLTADGFSVVFISHKLDEVLEISHRITVLRQGKRVATVPAATANHRMLANLMVGRTFVQSKFERKAETGEPQLVVRAVSTAREPGVCPLVEIDLTVSSGEIVGVAGVAGNGQRELSEILTGARLPGKGSVIVAGRDVTGLDALAFVRAGIGHIPEDRLRDGIAGALPLTDNAILREYHDPPISAGAWLKQGAIREFTRNLLAAANVSAPGVNLPIRNLSGGNQQRFVVARETRVATRALVAVYPTRGLDIAATEMVRQALVDLRNRGVAILVVSEDLDELLVVADRIVVMFAGRIVGERRTPCSRDELGMLLGGKTDGFN
ncbi:MAG: ABC transporter ATP-binding protein [Parvibaculaceae bacterium]